MHVNCIELCQKRRMMAAANVEYLQLASRRVHQQPGSEDAYRRPQSFTSATGDGRRDQVESKPQQQRACKFPKEHHGGACQCTSCFPVSQSRRSRQEVQRAKQNKCMKASIAKQQTKQSTPQTRLATRGWSSDFSSSGQAGGQHDRVQAGWFTRKTSVQPGG